MQVFGAGRLFDARLDRSAEGGRAWPCRKRHHQCHPRPERPGRCRHHRCFAEPAGCRSAAERQCAGPPADAGGVRQHHRQDRRRTAKSPVCAMSPASNSALPTTRCARCSTASRPSPSRSSRRPGSNAITISDERPEDHGRAADWPCLEGVKLRDRLRHDEVRPCVDREGRRHAARSHRARRPRGHPVPADMARLDHPADRRSGLDHRYASR